MVKQFKHSQAGIAHLAVILVVVIVFGAAIATFLLVRSSNDNMQKNEQTAQQEIDEGEGGAVSRLQMNQRNTERRNDVSRFMGATNEFVNNNSGSMPTVFLDGQLTGKADSTPVTVDFEVYSDVSFASGTQSAIANLSELRVVTGAKCQSDGSAAFSSSSRQVAVQFGTEKSGNGVKAECEDL